jgi:hypothetical protein
MTVVSSHKQRPIESAGARQFRRPDVHAVDDERLQYWRLHQSLRESEVVEF